MTAKNIYYDNVQRLHELSIRMMKKGDLSDFEFGMIVAARRAGLSISGTADLCGIFPHNHLCGVQKMV